MSLNTGDVFAGYTVVRRLGSGGMGEVYLAKHPRLPRQDALKVLPTAISADSGFRTRFEREADLAASLWHPHIVGVHDRGEFEGRLWIAMDYVEGSDAAKLLRDQFPQGMPARDVAEIVVAVAEALDYAHEQQLLHRDVKPANILLTDTSKARRRILLADFGIARHTDDVTGLTATNMTVGSVNYTAPEQLTGDHIDGRADQYALAATAFHLLTGNPPFPHTNPAVVISRHLGTPPPALADTHPTLAALDPVLARALSKNPTERFDTCTDFATALTTPSTHTAVTDTPTTATGGARTPATRPPPADPPTTLLSTPPTTMVTAAATTPASTPTERPPIVVSAWGTSDEPTARDESEDAELNVQGGSPPSTGRSPATGLLVWIGVAVVVALVGAIALNAAGTTTSSHSSSTTYASPPTTRSAAPATSSRTAATTSQPTLTAAAPTTTREVYPPGHNVTIADYIKAGGIIETPTKRGDPGSPTINLPIPAGWADAGAQTPSYAWGAIVSTDPTLAADPPSVVALLSKLTGAAEATSIIEYAPGELKNLPGFEGGDGDKSTLSGFDAFQIGGSYMKDGVKRMIAQKTVVIPGRGGGLFVLQLNADGLEDHMGALMDVTSEIDEKSVITP